MSKFLVVVNPTARRGNGMRSLPNVRTILAQLGARFDVVLTERPGHAVEIAQQVTGQDYEAIAAVGGDGTVNELANGLLRASGGGPTALPLGVIPVGSGNDFAYLVWREDITIEQACRRLVEGENRLQDVGTVTADGENFRYFANGLGIGFDAQVNIETRQVKFFRGFLMYFWAVLRTIVLHYRPTPVTVVCDEELYSQLLLMVSISVGRRLGGGFLLTPSAEADDGLLDLCIAADVSRPAIFPLIPRLMQGTHVTHPKCTMTRARNVVVDSEIGLPAHIDGEIYTHSARRYQMQSLPGRLWVRC